MKIGQLLKLDKNELFCIGDMGTGKIVSAKENDILLLVDIKFYMNRGYDRQHHKNICFVFMHPTLGLIWNSMPYSYEGDGHRYYEIIFTILGDLNEKTISGRGVEP